MKKLLCLALALMLALTMTCALAEDLVAEEGAKIEFCYWESSDTIHDTWEKIIADFRALHPEIELYDPDGYHPSPAGTYLAACLFLSVLTGHSPMYFAIPDIVSTETGGILRCIADWQLSKQYMPV